MTKRLPCPVAPGPLEDYAAQFDPLFGSLAQRRSLRAYLQGLLLPRDRNKTLTALAGAEPADRTSWPVALRAVRAWLTPWSVLWRCWRSWSPAPPPAALQRLLDGLTTGRPLHLYLPP